MIKLDEEFSLEQDKFCWMLNFRREGEINPETLKPIVSSKTTYHGSLKFALLNYMDECLKPADSVKDLLVRLNMVENRILKLKNSN